MRDRIVPVLLEGAWWVFLAGAAFALSYQFNEPLSQYRYGATGWPRVLATGIGIFGLIQVVWRFFHVAGRTLVMGQSERSDAAHPEEATGGAVHFKRAATFGVPLAYLFLMPRMGFYVITPLFLIGYMILLGERRFRVLLGTTLLIYGLTILIFTALLFVPLPVGNWPGFYEVNALFVSLFK